jgi:chromate reductase, NAD(P)H dehydrogenase (quinone)
MIALIIGTNRPGSNTRKIAVHLEEFYAALKVPVRVLDLAQLPPEIFAPTAYATKPAGFQPFADTILQASGLHVVTPEYNGGMPGVLKYFIDMLKFPESFERRPVCFVGVAAGIWGALRPVEQLQAIFGYRNAHLYPERVFLPQVHNLLDAQGRLKDAELLKRLQGQTEGFVEFVERVKQVKLRGA